MRDPQAYVRGRNRSLAIAIGAGCVVFGAVLVGPGASYLESLREDRASLEVEYSRWQEDYREYQPVTSRERAAWVAEWSALEAWLPAARDEPSIMAAVARQLEQGGVRRLQVQRRSGAEQLPPGVAAAFDVRAPVSDGTVHVRAVALTIHLEASAHDLRATLERLERKEIPALVEEVHVHRTVSGVRARIELVFFTRVVPST
jgi:hypothetical protein